MIIYLAAFSRRNALPTSSTRGLIDRLRDRAARLVAAFCLNVAGAIIV